MKRLILVLAIVALPAAAWAAPLAPCATYQGSDVLVVNSLGGCTVDGLIFKDFSYLNAGQVDSPFVTFGTSSFMSGVAFIAYNPNLGSPTLQQDIWFYFTVLGGVIGVDATNAGDPTTALQERVCTGGIVNNVCTGMELASFTVFGGQSNTVMFDRGYDPVYVFKDINTPAGTSMSAFTQSFHVPEPGSLMLLGTGLIGLAGAVRRRLRK